MRSSSHPDSRRQCGQIISGASFFFLVVLVELQLFESLLVDCGLRGNTELLRALVPRIDEGNQIRSLGAGNRGIGF